MIKRLIIILCALFLFVAAAPAQQVQEKKEPGLSAWVRDLQKKIGLIPTRKAPMVTPGAAGVRGAGYDGARSGLYWKGKNDRETVTEEELQDFKEVLALAVAGKGADAISELEEFMRQYPDSALIPDAKKTLDLLRADPAAERKTEPAAPVRK